MTPEKIIHNVNQIADYFAAYPHQEAIEGVADHVNRFWEKRLRERLHELMADNEPQLNPLVCEARPLIRK